MGRTSHKDIAAMWRDQITDFAEGSNMSFKGKVLYHGTGSWRMPIGILTDRTLSNGKRLVLSRLEDLGGRGWGNRSPQDHMRRALYGDKTHICYLPAGLMEIAQRDLDEALASWPAYEISTCQEHWARLAKPHSYAYYGDGSEAARIQKIRNDYAAMAANASLLGVPVPDECEKAVDTAIAAVEAAFKKWSDPKATAKREKAALAREKRAKKELARHLAKIAGGLETTPFYGLPRKVREHVSWDWRTKKYTVLSSGWEILREVGMAGEENESAA